LVEIELSVKYVFSPRIYMRDWNSFISQS